MDIRRLRVFKNVYELRSFSKTGEEMFLSQPTISAHIAVLEEQLGVSLFDRLGRKTLPTPAGRILYKAVNEIFKELDTAIAELDLMNNRVAGELSIGGSTIPAKYILPDLLASFVKLYPDVVMRFEEGDTASVSQAVYSGSLLLGVVGAKSELSEVVSIELMSDDLVLVVPVNWPYPEDDPEKWPWIMRERGSGTRKSFEQALESKGIFLNRLKIVARVSSTDAVLSLVSAGMGASVVSRIAAKEMMEKRLIRQIKDPAIDMTRSFYLIYRQGRQMFPVKEKFLEFATSRLGTEK